MSSSENHYLPSTTSTWALVSLISGVLAWIGVFGLGGIAAVITGHIAKNEIRQSSTRMTGDGMATAGLILGYANIALTLLGICLLILLLITGVTVPFICLPFVNQSGGNFHFR